MFTRIIIGIIIACFCVNTLAGTPDLPSKKQDIQHIPHFLINSYIGLDMGWAQFPFINKDLNPGYQAQSFTPNRVGVRIFVGHYFNPYIAAQLSLMRPIRWVKVNDITPGHANKEIWMSLFGITVLPTWPITPHFSLFGEVGYGLISRHGFRVNDVYVVNSANISTALLGAGFQFHISPNWHLNLEGIYSTSRPSQGEPHVVYVGLGFYYIIFPNKAAASRSTFSPYYFPKNLIQLGYFNSSFFDWYVNPYFAPPYLPIFWKASIQAKRGEYLMYERMIYHTTRWFSVGWGTSFSHWVSSKQSQNLFALSIFPEIKIWFVKSKGFDLYFTYAIAGPTYISRSKVDGNSLGSHFTFQDFLGLGALLGKSKRVNVILRITHYSNGNLFPQNPGFDVPVELGIGVTF